MAKSYIVNHHLKFGGKLYEPTEPGKTVKLDLPAEIETHLTRPDGALSLAPSSASPSSAEPQKAKPAKPSEDDIDAAVTEASKAIDGKKPGVKAVEALLKADITAADLEASWGRLKAAK